MKIETFVAAAVVLAVATTAPLLAGDIVEVQTQATMGEVTPEKALVYFVRPAFSGKAVKFWAMCDQTALGATKGKTYLWAHVDPGEHVFWSKGENISALKMSVEAGQTYYLKQSVRMGGLKARVKLESMSDAEAGEALAKIKYVTLTEEGVQRGLEVASEGWATAQEKAAKGDDE